MVVGVAEGTITVVAEAVWSPVGAGDRGRGRLADLQQPEETSARTAIHKSVLLHRDMGHIIAGQAGLSTYKLPRDEWMCPVPGRLFENPSGPPVSKSV
jgi:hypothetical protein